MTSAELPDPDSSPPATGVDDGLDQSSIESAAPGKSLARRSFRRATLLLITLLVFNYLVLPQLAGAREALDTLSHVTWWLLVVGVALEFAALASYTQLTMATLTKDRHNRPIGFFTLLRIQLSSKSVTNLVPGGSATGSALSYRLMTTSGLTGTQTGFALATVGLGSAVVLNLLFWIALLVSIPRRGSSRRMRPRPSSGRSRSPWWLHCSSC